MFRTHRFLCIILILFVLLRLPSLFEPYWYGDEGIYQTVGMAMREGRMLYTEIWDNKPPLLFLLYAVVDGDQIWMRVLSLIAGCASVVVFYLLAREVLKRTLSVYIATAIFGIVFASPLLEGNIANAENFMLLPTLLCMVFLLTRNFRTNTYIPLVCGVLLSVSFLLKAVAVFDLLAITCFLLFGKEYRRLLWVWSGFSLLPLCTDLYFFTQGTLPFVIQTVFTDTIGYVEYHNDFIISNGLLMVKSLVLICMIVLLFFQRKQYSSEKLFVSLWLVCSLYSVYFSGRGYVHYLLLLLPAYALLAGQVSEEKKRYSLSLAVLGIVTILTVVTFNIYGNTIWYYTNAVSYLAGIKSETQYRAFFDPITVRNYRIAAFINRNLTKEDRVFIWGNGAQIYKMTDKLPPGRFTVAYHIIANGESKRETEQALRAVKPKLLVILPGYEQYPYGYEGYTLKTIIDGGELYERTTR